MKKILFISHDATLTGAPKLLLNLIMVLKQKGLRVNVLLKSPQGSLYNDFKTHSEIFGHYYKEPSNTFLARINRKLFHTSSLQNIDQFVSGIDFVINNTITNGDLLPVIRSKFSGPILTYVHELEIASSTYTNKEDVEKTIACTDTYLVPCDSVRMFLINKLRIQPAKIETLNYYIERHEHHLESSSSYNNGKYHGEFIVGGCGTQDWRKGADIFLQVAKKVFTDNPGINILFKWKGANLRSIDHLRLIYDAEKLGIQDRVEFIESSSQTDDFYAGLDLFLLPSREDPYPLVVLEAASFEIPSVGFLNAGGASEFIADDAGTSVQYLSVDEMAKSIIGYYQDRDMLATKGKRALEKLKALHQNAGLILQQLNEAYLKGKISNGESVNSSMPSLISTNS